jgi:hypothetical protein
VVSAELSSKVGKRGTPCGRARREQAHMELGVRAIVAETAFRLQQERLRKRARIRDRNRSTTAGLIADLCEHSIAKRWPVGPRIEGKNTSLSRMAKPGTKSPGQRVDGRSILGFEQGCRLRSIWGSAGLSLIRDSSDHFGRRVGFGHQAVFRRGKVTPGLGVKIVRRLATRRAFRRKAC